MPFSTFLTEFLAMLSFFFVIYLWSVIGSALQM